MSLKDLFVPKENAETPPATKQKTNVTPTKTIIKTDYHAPISIMGNDNNETEVSTVQTTTTSNSTSAPTAGKKAEFKKYLQDALVKTNAHNADYEAFAISLEKMKAKPMTESDRFQTAFAAFESMGLTSDTLIETAGNYLEVLNHEKEKFESGIQGHTNELVTAKEKQIETLTKENESIEEQMTALNDKKLANEKAITQLDQEKSSADAQLNSQHNDFINAHTESIAEINKNVELIKKYLTNTQVQQ